MCIGFATLYKYAQIEEKWTLRIAKRIKEMGSVEDIIVGQPLLIWSAYTYNASLGNTPALWICLLIEEFRCEVRHVCLFGVNGYSTLFPNHKFSLRKLKSTGRNILEKFTKLIKP